MIMTKEQQLAKRDKQQRRQVKRVENCATRANSNTKPDTAKGLRRALVCILLFFVSLSLAALTYSNYPGWGSNSYTTNNPVQVAIDQQTGDLFVGYQEGLRMDVVPSGTVPRITIYSPAKAVYGIILLHRTCAPTGALLYGLFIGLGVGTIQYMPLPLPASPSTSNVPSTIVTVASGLAKTRWLTQTFNTIELYVAEKNGPHVSHWAVNCPAVGANPTITKIRNVGNFAAFGTSITSDDNVLLVSAYLATTIYKATPMLGTPTITTLSFSNTLTQPYKLTMHPAHSSASNFILYVVDLPVGKIFQYNAVTASDSLLVTVLGGHGYNPIGVTVRSDGTLIIAAYDGLKVASGVGSYSYSTQVAGYLGFTAAPTSIPTPVPTPVPTREQTNATSTPEPTNATDTPEPTDAITPEPTTVTTTPEPTNATPTPEPTNATDTPEPTDAITPEPTTVTTTPEPTNATPTPEPANATDTPEPTDAITPEPTNTSKPARASPPAVATTVTVATSTVVYGGAVAAVVAGGGGGAALEMQGVLVIGMSSCAGPATASAASSSKTALVPLQLTDGIMGMLLGSLVLVVSVFVLHAVVVAVKKFAMNDKKARNTLRFPSHSFRVVQVLYQGIAFACFAALFDKAEVLLGDESKKQTENDRTMDVAVSAVFLVPLLALPLVVCVYLTRRCKAKYVLYRHVFRDSSRLGKMLVHPEGYWKARDAEAGTWAFAYSSLRGKRYWVHATHPFLQSIWVSIAVLSGMSCEIQSALLILVFVFLALIIIIVRPFRHSFTHVSRVVMLFASAVLAGRPLFGLSDDVEMYVLMTSAGISVLLTLFAFVIQFRERKWKKAEERAIRMEESESESDSDSDYSSDDSGAMSLNQRAQPMLNVPSAPATQAVATAQPSMLQQEQPAASAQVNVLANPLHQQQSQCKTKRSKHDDSVL